MVQNSKTTITDESKLLSNEQIRGIKLNDAFFDGNLNDQDDCNNFFAAFRLIPNSSSCASCNGNQRTLKKCSRYIDKCFWFCNICKNGASIRSNSFFENSRLSTKLILKILYKYLNKVEFVQIAFDLEISRATVSEYCDLFREAICYYVERNGSRIGGIDQQGNPKIVEMDESLFFRRKYNRGRIRNEQWYIGGIEGGY